MAEQSPDHSHLELFEREHWHVGLHPKQTYLGRAVAILKRELEDPLECTDAERDELWTEVLPVYKKLVDAAFEPVRINYGHLANDRKQVHWHLVPRYEDPNEREFEGLTFVDSNVGHNYSPHPAPPEGLTEEYVQMIRQKLKSNLSQ